MTSKLNDLRGRMTRLRQGLNSLDLDTLKGLLDEVNLAHLATLDEAAVDRLLDYFHSLGIHWAGSHSQSLLNTDLPALEAMTAELKHAEGGLPQWEVASR